MTKAKAATLTQVTLAGYWLLLFIGTHLPATTPFLPGHRFDKLYHGLVFAVLALLLSTAWTFTFGRVTWRGLAVVLVVLALYGVVDELTQPFVGRASSIYDWLADMAGAVAGITLFVWARRRLETRELARCNPSELE